MEFPIVGPNCTYNKRKSTWVSVFLPLTQYRFQHTICHFFKQVFRNMKASATGSWARPGNAPPCSGEFASLGERATSWGLEVTAEMSVHWILVGGAGHQVHHHGVPLLSFLTYSLSPSLAGGPSLPGALLAEGSAHPRGSPSAITAPVHWGSSFLPPRAYSSYGKSCF